MSAAHTGNRTAEHNKSYETLRPMLSRTLFPPGLEESGGERLCAQSPVGEYAQACNTRVATRHKKGSHLNYEFVAAQKSRNAQQKSRNQTRSARLLLLLLLSLLCISHWHYEQANCISGR